MSAVTTERAVQYLADEEFDYVIVATGPGTARAETTDGAAILSIGARQTMVQGKVPNVRVRMRQHYPNATEVKLGKRVAAEGFGMARIVPPRRAHAPLIAALPIRRGFAGNTPRPTMDYGDPMDAVYPPFRELLGVWQAVPQGEYQ